MGRAVATVVVFLAVVGVAFADSVPRIPVVSALNRRKLAATLAKAARPFYNSRLKLTKGHR